MSHAYIIAVAHESGGVGRTTTTLHLGYALACLGQRVCLVDLDPSGDLSRRLGLSPADPTLMAALAAAADPPLPQPCRWGGIRLDVVPSDSNLAVAELLVADLPQGRDGRLTAVLKPAQAQYDFVLLDCPAHKGLLLVNALYAADAVLVPVPSQDNAYAALVRTAATLAIVREYHDLPILGYLLTLTTRRSAAQAIVAALRADYPALVFRTVIPRRGQLTLDGRYQAPVGVYAPGGAAARAYHALAVEVLARVAALRPAAP